MLYGTRQKYLILNILSLNNIKQFKCLEKHESYPYEVRVERLNGILNGIRVFKRKVGRKVLAKTELRISQA